MTGLRVIGVVFVGVLLALASARLAAQDKAFVRVTEQQAQAAMSVAAAAAKTNVSTLQSTFQREMRKLASDYDNKPFLVHEAAECQIAVVGRAQMLLQLASERVRNGEPVAAMPYPTGAAVFVSPLSIDAPDIVDIIVTRDGKTLEPLHKDLQRRDIALTEGPSRGMTKTVHEGAYIYPMDAFDPGTSVTVQAVSASGRKYSKTLFDRDLRKLQ